MFHAFTIRHAGDINKSAHCKRYKLLMVKSQTLELSNSFEKEQKQSYFNKIMLLLS